MIDYSNVEFKAREMSVSERPIFIVGQNPGKARYGPDTGYAWDGTNRSSKFLKVVLDDMVNIYLTNICNYQTITPERLRSGIESLDKAIKKYQPHKIICLGQIAGRHVKQLIRNQGYEIEVHVLLHPSYILRFNKDKHGYSEKIRQLIISGGDQ